MSWNTDHDSANTGSKYTKIKTIIDKGYASGCILGYPALMSASPA